MKYFALFPFVFFIACDSDTHPPTTSVESTEVTKTTSPDGMLLIAGGTMLRGHDGDFETPNGIKSFPEEKPAHKVTVNSFWIDRTEVTNDQFTAFVEATGYITFAERIVKADSFPAAARANLPGAEFKNGSIVFIPQSGTEGDLNAPNQHLNWWRWEPEANWQAPMGPGSNIDGKGNHPVVCVTYEDASAYANWAGKRLPTEAEWEFAARGGLEGKAYTWGDDRKPPGPPLANIWQGDFPNQNSKEDGFFFSAPVGTYPPNGYGLHDMAGNVWEICRDLYDPQYFSDCESDNPMGPKVWVNRDTGERGAGLIHRVTKGGSFLCHESYCLRYRPAARQSQDTESPTNHTGFRCVRDVAPND